MEFKDFQRGALRTESPGTAYDTRMDDARMVRHIMNLLTRVREVGELANFAKRALYYGKPYVSVAAVDPAPDEVAAAVLTLQFKRMLHAVLGFASETAEMVEILEWMANHGAGRLRPTPVAAAGEELTAEDLRFTAHHAGEEFGDNGWYGAVFADAAGFDPDEYLERVLAKLRKRFPDAFTEEAAGNRDLDAEARALAGGATCT